MRQLLFFSLVIMIISLSYNVDAALNRALKLDGDPDSAMEAPDHPSLDANLGKKLTIEAWVNPGQSVGELMVVNKEDVYEMAVKDGLLQTAIQPAGQGWEWWNSQGKVPVNTWTHIAVTYDGSEIKTFLNGKFLAKFSKSGPLNDSPDTLKVGRRTRGGATHSAYIGLIDEVRISNAIRYDKDFDVPQGAFLPDDDTVALYHFDEEIGGKIKDFSKHGNDGELVKKATLEDIDLSNTVLAVQPKNKLAAIWGKIKRGD
ncbi:TPA: LamG domain-containing protein [Candidatus Poribacteria bacterium]|nr:LamG domain-containing protein [Candidatus Poribacteria bacterium]